LTAQELRDWLVDTLQDELRDLACASATLEIDNLTIDSKLAKSESFDWQRLLLAASMLASSSTGSHREAALRISTGALLLAEDQSIRDAGAVIFGKLSNQRAVDLALEKGRIQPGLNGRLGVTMRLESERQRLEQSILLDASGERLDVNQFQRDLWAAAQTPGAWVSASAPTASGKTFLILKWLVDELRKRPTQTVVYLAPTRALVSEIEGSLIQLAKTARVTANITSIPSMQHLRDTAKTSEGRIFVVTQERLHLLTNIIKHQFQVDLLVIDEAHKIGDPRRGVILQDAVERTLRANPGLRAIFVSPGTRNPEVLLEDTPADRAKIPVESDLTTVLQNLITAEQVSGRPTEWSLKLKVSENYHHLGILTLPGKPSSLKKRIAFIAAAAGARGGTLIYANGAAEAEEIAFLVTQLIPGDTIVDPELCELAELARKGVHRNYRLAPAVERGIAFHYGNMPSPIRLEIERLFKAGKIKFLICTSTLIEGVNLSCRTIIVRGPRKGTGNPMDASDFWNLAGRAGRWGNEFQGNIICIDTASTSAWPEGVPERSRQPIKRESDIALDQASALSNYLISRSAASPIPRNINPSFEPVSAYLLSIFMREGTLTTAPFAKRHSPTDLAILERAVGAAIETIQLPAEIAVRNPGVSLVGLQRLNDYFQTYPGKLEDLLPLLPGADDAYDRFSRVMELTNSYVYPAFQPPGLIPLHAVIVVEWLRGLSLPTIIRKRIEYHERKGRKFELPKLIRETLELIESTARYLAPKYFSAYVDVLNHFLIGRDRQDLINKDLDIGIALELGISSVTLRSLMDLGMSRMAAVFIYEKIALDRLSEEECMDWAIQYRDQLDALGLPASIVREFREQVLAKAEERRAA
jgi:hypothetical protein